MYNCDYNEDNGFDELKQLTTDLLNHGWLWSGASILDKEKRSFAMAKCVVWRNEYSNEWISHSTAIHFNFDHEEPFAMFERERKVLSMNYEPDDSFCPGLSSYDIEIIAQILKAGRAYYGNQSNR